MLSQLTPLIGIAQVVEAPVRPPEPPTAYELAERYFGDSPRMMAVIKCESNFEQYRNGVPLLSPTHDWGIMQINKAHEANALAMGLDIKYSTEDNLKYGRWLYEREGTKPWTCIKKI